MAEYPTEHGDAGSVLEMLYDRYNECHGMDTAEIKADFGELYRRMQGLSLQKMDKIVDTVCDLCKDHQRSWFEAGVKIGMQLHRELAEIKTGTE